jgi:NAD(P)-dependent dehydrogenase (short-subunit alcohol dehydrogenase family)
MKSQQVALVTGASSGIGKATAQQLLKDGLTVYVAARRVEKMKDLQEQGAIPIKMDITVEEDIQQALRQIGEDHQGVDILVNNAGYAIYGAIEDTTIEDARRQFDVNIFGLARLTQLVLPYMRAQKAGKIINVSSVGGKIYTPLGAWYHATKHALEGWSDCLRLEVAPFGIDVVIIEPGGIKTEFGDVMTEPMMERSGSTAYAELAKKVKAGVIKTYDSPKISGPEVIADVIARAVKSSKPKTRYSAGYMSGIVLFMRRWLSDRMFDRVIMSQA